MFRVQVVFTKAIRAKSYHSQDAPHNFNSMHRATDPYERLMGTQVLMDILLLAKCDHFLHAESSVASLAAYFNPYMKSYFMEPGKYYKVCLFVCLFVCYFNPHMKSYFEFIADKPPEMVPFCQFKSMRIIAQGKGELSRSRFLYFLRSLSQPFR